MAGERSSVVIYDTDDQQALMKQILMAVLRSHLARRAGDRAILDVRDSATKSEIRKAYKALVKVLHPDMNGGDRSQEEQLSEVVWAWELIRASRSFRD